MSNFKFSSKSLSKLKGVHPDLVKVVHRALALSETDMTIVDGLRTIETQRQYVESGASKTMNSKHLKQPDGFGHAVDIYPYDGLQIVLDWGNPWPGEVWANVSKAMKTAAKELGVNLTWGGDWKRFRDGPHYEIDASKAFEPKYSGEVQSPKKTPSQAQAQTKMTSQFKLAYDKTMSHEGLYANDPLDSGGETWKGVSRRAHPDFPGWTIIDSIKKNNPPNLSHVLQENIELESLVQALYKKEYWDVFDLDNCSFTSLSQEIFDTAVNMGAGQVTKFIQRILNVFCTSTPGWVPLEVDGSFGSSSKKAFSKFITTYKESALLNFIKALNCLQGARYIEICEEKPSQTRFIQGWFNWRI